MQVTNGYHPHSNKQQRTNTKHTGFADMFASMAANKSREDRAEKHGDGKSNHMGIATLNIRLANPHRFHGTQIKPTAEELAMVEENETVEPARGVLQVHEACTAEVVECKAPDPKYPASIYDIPESELEAEITAARIACSYLDTEGLTKAEIYNRIEIIFKDYLGKDFKEPILIYGGVKNVGDPGSYPTALYQTFSSFDTELSRAGVSIWDEPEILIEARGYTGMSETEMRAAVRANYPETMTVKDCIVMAEELWRLGLEDGNYGYYIKDHIFSTLGLDQHRFASQIENIYDIMLDMPADFGAIKASYEAYVKDDYALRPTYNMDTVFDRLTSWFGSSGLGSGAILNELRVMLEEMEKEGVLGFDKDGYCRSPEKL